MGAAVEGVVFPNEKGAPEDCAGCEAAGVGRDDAPNAKVDVCATAEASGGLACSVVAGGPAAV